MKVPAFIKQLAKLVDNESSRYALGGVQILSDGKTCQLTATDGRVLANVAYADDEETEPKPVSAIVSAGDVPNAPVFKSPVSFDGTTWRQAGKVVSEVKPVDGRFPRIEDVFENATSKGYVAVKLDAALLRKLCDLSASMNDDDRTKGITLYVKDAKSCVFAATSSTSGHVARMAIMPRAADGDYKPDPFPPKPGTAPAAEIPAAESAKRGGKAPASKAKPATPPEMMDAEQVATAIREPDEVGDDWSSSLAPI